MSPTTFFFLMIMLVWSASIFMLFRNNWVFRQVNARNEWVYKTRIMVVDHHLEHYDNLASYDVMMGISYPALMLQVWRWNPETIWSWDWHDFIITKGTD